MIRAWRSFEGSYPLRGRPAVSRRKLDMTVQTIVVAVSHTGRASWRDCSMKMKNIKLRYDSSNSKPQIKLQIRYHIPIKSKLVISCTYKTNDGSISCCFKCTTRGVFEVEYRCEDQSAASLVIWVRGTLLHFYTGSCFLAIANRKWMGVTLIFLNITQTRIVGVWSSRINSVLLANVSSLFIKTNHQSVSRHASLIHEAPMF